MSRWKSRKAGERALRYIFSCVPRRAAATASALATVGFSFDDESTVNSKDGLTVTTSGSQNLRRRSNWNLCACSFPLCTTRSPGRGRACHTLPGSAAMYAEGTASRLPTAKGLVDIGVRRGSAPIYRGGSSHRPFSRAADLQHRSAPGLLSPPRSPLDVPVGIHT